MKALPSFSLVSLFHSKEREEKRMDDDIWDPLEEVEMEELDSSDEG